MGLGAYESVPLPQLKLRGGALALGRCYTFFRPNIDDQHTFQ